MTTDLLGKSIKEPTAADLAKRIPVRKSTIKNGYAATPGHGPQGETCKTCKHSVSVGGGSRNFRKCAAAKHKWTGGAGSDILQKSPACLLWAPIEAHPASHPKPSADQ